MPAKQSHNLLILLKARLPRRQWRILWVGAENITKVTLPTLKKHPLMLRNDRKNAFLEVGERSLKQKAGAFFPVPIGLDKSEEVI
jgi:hypothetical protein